MENNTIILGSCEVFEVGKNYVTECTDANCVPFPNQGFHVVRASTAEEWVEDLKRHGQFRYELCDALFWYLYFYEVTMD